MPRRSASSRIEFYDRNPTLTNLLYNAVLIAPHANTVRATYTLPANRFAKIVSISLQLIRDVVATTTGLSRTTARVNSLTLQEAFVLGTGVTGAVNDRESVHIGHSGFIYTAGQTITIETNDGATGGSFIYRNFIEIIEFDP